ncbi:MAG: HAD family hydrolase [Deltaproteobacteria bacterium]|nr:HAD family hydrolase [Deltaproteobacteria bacterium]
MQKGNDSLPPTRQAIRSVIFDCDGVMFDSRQANTHFYNHLLDHFGLPPMTEAQEVFVHMHTADDSVRRIFEGTPHTEAAQEYRMNLDYTPFIHDMVMEPGLKDLLSDLKRTMRLAVATNRSNTLTTVLEVFELKDYFDMVVSSLDVTRPKPHPESIHKILSFFNIKPTQAVYVGDSPVDLETAQASGVHFVAYRNPELNTRLHAKTMGVLGHVVASFDGKGKDPSWKS